MKSTLAISSIIFTVGILSLPIVWGDNDYNWGNKENKYKTSDIAAITNPAYIEECGSCHLAYPPGLLPARSWSKIMTDLDSHFGDNAELESETAQSISQFLLTYSADQSDYRLSRKFNQSIKNADIPTRITDIPYFIHEHDEIPERMVSANPQVRSLSQCNACHTGADQGVFNEDNVNIPGYGRWDD